MISNIQYKKTEFPCGEIQVTLSRPWAIPSEGPITIDFIFEKVEEIFELALVCDAIKRNHGELYGLVMAYAPFGRQDRVAVPGESFSLKVFADLINSLGFQRVIVTDPHSDVTTALINNCEVIHQHEVFKDYFKDKKNFYLVSPDGGALKKIYKLAQEVKPKDVVECSKLRNVSTGEITGVKVNGWAGITKEDCYIVDDICDGGRTFVEIAKLLKERSHGKIILMVTHGFFTNPKGIGVFDGLIDEIYTRKGKIK